MTRQASYKTKQREGILSYIASLDDAHITAAQIVNHFASIAVPIGRTTVYRHLDKLTETGQIRRYVTDGLSGACYQYIEDSNGCPMHLHLKCEHCNQLQHLECETLDTIQKHIHKKHSFRVNALKTVLYGACENCQQ
jgi:Fur family ferric uptake transcriptional regulator